MCWQWKIDDLEIVETYIQVILGGSLGTAGRMLLGGQRSDGAGNHDRRDEHMTHPSAARLGLATAKHVYVVTELLEMRSLVKNDRDAGHLSSFFCAGLLP